MMFATLKSSILVISALVVAVTAESYTGKATYHTDWSTNACDGKPKWVTLMTLLPRRSMLT
jgi:hypothetical protein